MKTFGIRSAAVLVGVLIAHLALVSWLVLAPPLANPFAKRPEPVPVTIVVTPPATPAPPPAATASKVRVPKASVAKPRSIGPVLQTPALVVIEPSEPTPTLGAGGADAPSQPVASDPQEKLEPPKQIAAAKEVNPPPESAGQPSLAAPIRENEGPTLGLGDLSFSAMPREHRYIGYLNGNAVAKAEYRLAPSITGYEASFRIQATGVTAWFWRGERTDSSMGRVGAAGFMPERMRQQQGDRAAREQLVPSNALDLVSIVFQLSELGRQYPARLVTGFSGRVRVQKIGKIDTVLVEVLSAEPIVLAGKTYESLPVKLSDSASSSVQIIWFVPERDWAPVRLSVPSGKYQVEFRSSEMAAVQNVRESP
jgi:Protein of unknown function (DUF3108)